MLFLSLTAALVVQGSTPSLPSLESQLRQLIASSGAEVAIAYRTLDGKTELFLDADNRNSHGGDTLKLGMQPPLSGDRIHRIVTSPT